MLSTSLSAKVGFIDHFLLYIHFCFYLFFITFFMILHYAPIIWEDKPCSKPILTQYISAKIQKNIQKSDYMDGFCLQSQLDLTLFYKIEGCFDNLKFLMTLMTVTLMTGFRYWKMTDNEFDPSWPLKTKGGRYGRYNLSKIQSYLHFFS